MKVDLEVINQASTPMLKVDVKDELEEEATPTSAKYSVFDALIDDEGNPSVVGTKIKNRVSITSLASTMYISLDVADTVPVSSEADYRAVVIEYTYNSSLGNDKKGTEVRYYKIREIPGL